MVEKIDAFAHVLPQSFYEAMSEAHPTDELHAIDKPRFWDHEIRIKDLDDHGIDKQVVSLARPSIWTGIDYDDAVEITRIANDAVREFVDERPDRLIAIGTLPLMGEEFVAEFERCVDDLGMAGVQIFSNVKGEPIDGEEFLPLYEKAETKDVPIWLHPQLHEWHGWDEDYMLHKILGWPFDTSLALARLVFSGIMDEHPNLTIIPHHMAAMIPHFSNRIKLFHEMLVQHRDVYPYPVNDLDGDVEELFASFYADTCRCGDSDILEDGLSYFGEKNLVFATDYPFGPDEGREFLRVEVDGVENMDVNEDVRQRVYSENIRSLLS